MSAAAEAKLSDVKVVVFSAKRYVQNFLEEGLGAAVGEVEYVEAPLDHETARLAAGAQVVCCFVNDSLNARVRGAGFVTGGEAVSLTE